MRLIDSDSLKAYLKNHYSDREDMVEMLLGDVDSQPTVEAVKHGDWIAQYDLDGYIAYHECTNCKFALLWGPDDDLPKYCPECGARMKGEKECVQDWLMLTDITFRTQP